MRSPTRYLAHMCVPIGFLKRLPASAGASERKNLNRNKASPCLGRARHFIAQRVSVVRAEARRVSAYVSARTVPKLCGLFTARTARGSKGRVEKSSHLQGLIGRWCRAFAPPCGVNYFLRLSVHKLRSYQTLFCHNVKLYRPFIKILRKFL